MDPTLFASTVPSPVWGVGIRNSVPFLPKSPTCGPYSDQFLKRQNHLHHLKVHFTKLSCPENRTSQMMSPSIQDPCSRIENQPSKWKNSIYGSNESSLIIHLFIGKICSMFIIIWAGQSDHLTYINPFEVLKISRYTIKKTKQVSILLPGSIFCILTLLCWKSSVNHSRSCNLANCWRQSRKRGKWVPLSSGWASSEMLTSSEMMARAANCAKYDFTKGMSTSSLGHWSNTFRKALEEIYNSLSVLEFEC